LPHHPEPGGAGILFHLAQLWNVLLHGCKQRETTHKISHKVGTISSLVPDSKIITKGSRIIVTLIGSQNSRAAVSNRKKSVEAASTGQEKYKLDSIRIRSHWAFSKADQCSFFQWFQRFQNQIK